MNYHHVSSLAEKAQDQTAEALLSPIERQVVALSFGDRMSSVTTPTRLSALLRSLLYLPHMNRLASARLETLRRYAVLCRLSGDMSDTEDEAAMCEAGFSEAQVAFVEAVIRQHPKGGSTSRFGRWPIPLVTALLLAALAVGAWLG